ncbi:hypothetical protein B2G69_06330 [Methylorubrum zatmanii]|nr:hypothetical protein B2G69_06330 [Methylorubrum zatmanii]
MTGGALALAGATGLVDRLQVGDDRQHLLKSLWVEPKLAEAAQNVGGDGHARALQARASATVEATISSAVKWMRPAPAHSLQPGRALRMRRALMNERGAPLGKQIEHQRPFPTR